MSIGLNSVISAISIAMNLSQASSEISIIEDVSNVNYHQEKFLHHAKRSTYIALEISKELKLSDEVTKTIYVSTMLHDIGAANSLIKSHVHDSFIKEHCIIGSSIMTTFPYDRNISKIILYHHENWNGTGPMGKKQNFIPIESQIIRISDLIDLKFDEKLPSYKQKNKIIHWVKSKSEIIFSKPLVNAFLKIASKDIFWFNLENMSSINYIAASNTPKLDKNISLDEFKDIAYIFSYIVDNTSKFTARHSRDIAELSFKVSKFLGYDEEKCLKMKIAGLLHDIGKLAIPNSILDKQGALTTEEFSIIKSHAYYTKVILDNIENIPDISEWASNHHEKLNGAGYPQLLDRNQISEESRILCVCDIYQALTEHRPYRDGLKTKEAYRILDDMSNEGLLCKKAVNNLKMTLHDKEIYS